MTTQQREGQIVEAFVSLTDMLLDDFDVVDLLTHLTDTCAKLLDVAACGLLLTDAHGTLHVLAATSQATNDLELFQLQREEGPCLECFRDRTQVAVPDLTTEVGRWPRFVPAAAKAGFVSVHAVPMQVHQKSLGTLGLFGTTPGKLGQADLAVAQGLAHVATVAILHDESTTQPASYLPRLKRTQADRVVLEQATGLLYEHFSITMDQAFRLLRDHAHDTKRSLTQLARTLTSNLDQRAELLHDLSAAHRSPAQIGQQ